MRKLIVEVAADISQYVRGMSEAANVTSTLDHQVKELNIDTTKLAQAQVAASVKATERLRSQAAAYRALAASAAEGSAEQVAAMRLAEAAERKLAVSMGATAKETRAVRAETRGFERDLGHAGRGLASGTGLLHGFGRSLAFASGGFLAFEGVSHFLTESISAAREAGVAQRSLAAQMKASGESFRQNRARVEEVATSYEKFGFQNDEVIAGLTVLERGTGKVNQSLKLLQLTADIARAKNLDFGASAQIIAKVFGGQETALRRAVPGLEKNAHGWDLIREAQRKMAGQAAAATTTSERFAATLHNTEEIVGTALLPILNKYLTSLSKWLQRENESGDLQRKVTGAVKLFNDALTVTKTLLDPVITLFKALTSALHGTKNALYAVAGAWAALKIGRWAIGLRAAGAAAGEAGAAGKVGLLRTALLNLGPAGAIGTAAIAGTAAAFLYMQQKAQAAAEAADKAEAKAAAPGSGVETLLVPKLAAQIKAMFAKGATARGIRLALIKQLGDSLEAQDLIGEAFAFSAKSNPKEAARIEAAARKRAAEAGKAAGRGVQQGLRDAVKRTPEQLNQFFDAMIQRRLGRLSDLPLQQQIQGYTKIERALEQRIKKTKDITRKLNLEDQLHQAANARKAAREQLADQFAAGLQLNVDRAGLTAGMQDDIAAWNAVIAYLEKRIAAEKDVAKRQELESQWISAVQSRNQANAEAAQKARDAARARRVAAAQAAASAAQRKIDWAEFALERAQDTKGLKDDIRALKVIIALLKEQIRQTGLTVDRARQLRDYQKQLREALRPETTGGGRRGGILSGYHDIIPGGGGATLGFGGVGGAAPRPTPPYIPPHTGTPSTGFSNYSINNLVLTGVQDVKGMETELQKRSMARPQTRRGL